MECHCSAPLRWLKKGISARRYVDEHLSKRWTDDFNWRTGYVCPDSGQLWVLEFPEGSESARLRIVDDDEWRRLEHLRPAERTRSERIALSQFAGSVPPCGTMGIPRLPYISGYSASSSTSLVIIGGRKVWSIPGSPKRTQGPTVAFAHASPPTEICPIPSPLKYSFPSCLRSLVGTSLRPPACRRVAVSPGAALGSSRQTTSPCRPLNRPDNQLKYDIQEVALIRRRSLQVWATSQLGFDVFALLTSDHKCDIR